MAPRPSWIAFLLVCCASCEDQIYLPLPPGAGSFATIVEDSGSRQLILTERGDEPTLRFDSHDRSKLDVVAVVYGDRNLAELGLPVGEVPVLDPGPLTRGVPTEGAELYQARLDGTWEVLDSVPPLVSNAHFEDPSRRCPEITSKTFEIPGTGGVAAGGRVFYGARLDDTHAILGVGDGRLFVVDLEGGSREVVLSELDALPSAMFTNGESLWVGTATGSIYVGALREPFELSPYLTSDASIIDRLVVTQNQGRTDVVMLDRDRVLWHHDGSAWRQIYQYFDDTTHHRSKDVFEIAPGEVVSVCLSESKIARTRDGVTNLEEPTERPITGFSTGAHVRDRGTFIAGNFGAIYLDAEGRGSWVPAFSTESPVTVTSMSEHEGTLLLGTGKGEIEVIFPDEGRSCGPVLLDSSLIRVDVMIPLEGALIAGGQNVNPPDPGRFAVVRFN